MVFLIKHFIPDFIRRICPKRPHFLDQYYQQTYLRSP